MLEWCLLDGLLTLLVIVMSLQHWLELGVLRLSQCSLLLLLLSDVILRDMSLFRWLLSSSCVYGIGCSLRWAREACWIYTLVICRTTVRSWWIAHRSDHHILDVFVYWQVDCWPWDLHLLLYVVLGGVSLMVSTTPRVRLAWQWLMRVALPRSVWGLFLRISSSFFACRSVAILCWPCIRNLVIIHSHQFVYQVAKLRSIINLVAALSAHWALLVFKLLLQYYRRDKTPLNLLVLRFAISSSLTGSFSKCFLLFLINFEIWSISWSWDSYGYCCYGCCP